ncbi:hypothetical protein DL237_09335 [Pseudooceanicola sediminis]|uniref:Uncharacterized protein n=1 Tax=Pseudooceanicola sediminis TaxID=2211117 RepID=A0A399J8S2_9RHOB|nr:hypothetical protein E0K93_08480 [Puniceibacterium sp. HSS470]RII39046.1 hypothetical protein DL237_09335 [Pseudooceanicola sediminis]
MALRRPSLPKSLPQLPPSSQERLTPILYAGGMLAIGAVMLIAKPRLGHVPNPSRAGDLPRAARWRRAAQISRDNLHTFAPANVTDSIGRSLLLGGTALLLTRLLDEVTGHDGQ